MCGYTIQSRLGIGGMAEVWYAENKIGKKAAVKLLLPKCCDEEAVVSCFLTEAKVMVELDHPNIRQVYDYDNLDGRPTIIMEYLEGDDLKARMKAGQRFTDAELVKWWNQLVDALKYTHEKGIVHRDIKPGNIFVDNKGNIKLLDFGIAKVRESISSTQTGQKIGTLMYMSPEQVKDSKHIDYHTDIYSLAVTFVHLLTGKKPYDSDTSSDFDIQLNIVSKPLDLSDVPDKWQGFLRPYLDKEASKRPELRYFEAVMPERKPEPKPEPKKTEEKPAEQPDSDDEETIVDGAEEPKPAKKAEPEKSGSSESSDNSKNKSKLGLWIGLAVAAIAIGVAVFVLKPSQQETVIIDQDTVAYEACKTVYDYSAYISYYGKNAKHYAEAKSLIDKHVADSTQKAQQALAEAKAKKDSEVKAKKEAEAKAKAEEEARKKAEAEKQEYAVYYSCRTIEDCNKYLADYPKGQYVSEVKAKKKELENKIQEEKRKKEQEEKARKEAEAKAFTNKTFTVNGVSFEMITVKGGTFTMGGTSEQGSEADSDERPTHSVTLSDYYIGKFEVTQELWQAVMGNNPSYFKGNNLPVEQVSWNDVQEFIRKLNQKTGANFRLPTEAEWEYAARGGNKSKGYKYSGSNSIDNVAWYTKTTKDSGTKPVGTKSPNELGIYDMSGNVWEWCQDWYGYYSSSSQTNPTGLSSGSNRVRRGGSWHGSARICRVSNRDRHSPDNRNSSIGFRLAAGK